PLAQAPRHRPIAPLPLRGSPAHRGGRRGRAEAEKASDQPWPPERLPLHSLSKDPTPTLARQKHEVAGRKLPLFGRRGCPVWLRLENQELKANHESAPPIRQTTPCPDL